MKNKTINAIICKKFDEWTSSIIDENVRNLVRENSIITGGCIASMLLKEKINDFDVYFTNKQTASAVAHYYVNNFISKIEVSHEDGKKVKIWVDDDTERIKIHIKSAGIAGEESGNDYAYFENRDPEEGESYIDKVAHQISETDTEEDAATGGEKYRPLFLSANAITLSDKIQLVIRFYGDADKIHENYDYVHCTNYWNSKERKVILKQPALESILARELFYIGSKYPLCSIIRTRKFIKRGWTINAGQYLKMCFQVSQLDLTNLEVLEDQLVGVDAAYFLQLVDGLRAHSEKEKERGTEFKLEYGYLATLIDKIF